MAVCTAVVMGVSGVGKTTVGRLLAGQLEVPYADADDFHSPASIAKMSAGVPLEDADRWPWLAAIGAWLRERRDAGTGGVVTCSALRRAYRDVLRAADPRTVFVHLTGSPELIGERIGRRGGHFMPPSLLRSQLDTLEPPGPDERAVVLDVAPPPEELAGQAAAALRERWAADPPRG